MRRDTRPDRRQSPWQGPRQRPRQARGFTLIELLVVMAIVALLVSIAAPRYLQSVDRAREAALKTSLGTMRDAIDRFAADRARYPASLDELVQLRYLRNLPEDPLTGQRDSWVLLAPPPDSTLGGAAWDVRSGAAGRARDGSLYADW
jgi:general secretion pathway protein G